jgi:hypothetical protein
MSTSENLRSFMETLIIGKQASSEERKNMLRRFGPFSSWCGRCNTAALETLHELFFWSRKTGGGRGGDMLNR